MMIIVVILVGVLVYYTFNTNTNRNMSSNTSYPNFNRTNNANHALDILNERFAKGDIDEADYLKKKSILNQ